jgi:hypothetical protein
MHLYCNYEEKSSASLIIDYVVIGCNGEQNNKAHIEFSDDYTDIKMYINILYTR